MQPETSSVQLLVQAGAVGLCFYLIYVNRKAYNGQLTRMMDVIEKNSEVMGKFSEKLDDLTRK